MLDEAGNTPLRRLPEYASTLSGLGVQLVTIWQSKAQIETLYGKAAVAEDIGLEEVGTGQGQVTLAQNLESESAVDAFLTRAAEAGAKILKPAAKVFWGGYSGYFADLDGHVWEVAHNPFLPLAPDGSPRLPD